MSQDVGGVFGALIGLFGQQVDDQLLQGCGSVGAFVADVRGRGVQVLAHQPFEPFAGERRMAGQQGEQ
ncbi:hypothetical protein, partial [Thermomonospora catenispora]|uniref:hypothetical protein n=1 Tax=Thermomonospora catenispora TaxID=2493090 RepID=UPI001F4F727F